MYVVTWWRSWLRHCATSWKAAGSISDGVTGIFHCVNPSGRTMSPESLTEISVYLPWEGGGVKVHLQGSYPVTRIVNCI